ncbi:MAG TPA: hypothetical protein VED59_06655 [Acidimicrobiales bacterium]|nr:hypothetical protein [Acidimicrobiales bacterium]
MPLDLRSIVLTVVVGAAALSACGAHFDVQVDVGASGGGSVAMTVNFPQATAAEVQDLRTGLPVADLMRAGWIVRGPVPGPEGGIAVTASHQFSNLGQVPTLVADLAGSGPPAGRPFRLAVTEQRSLLQNRFVASGTVDLRCRLSCFDDPRLAARVGYPLGLPPAAVARLLGPHPADELRLSFEVVLPGQLVSTNAAWRGKKGREEAFVWSPALGQADPLAASSETLRTTVLDGLLAAVAGGALLVLVTAGWLWRRRH